MKQVKVIIEYASDGSLSAYIPDGNALDYGIIGTGDTKEDTINDFYVAYEGMKDLYKKNGEPFEEADFSFEIESPSFGHRETRSTKRIPLEKGLSPKVTVIQ